MMNIPIAGPFGLSIVLFVVAVLCKYFLVSRRPKDFPPGPPIVPFLGNITQVPRAKAFLKYVTSTWPEKFLRTRNNHHHVGFRAGKAILDQSSA